jgi:hypothetical protein
VSGEVAASTINEKIGRPTLVVCDLICWIFLTSWITVVGPSIITLNASRYSNFSQLNILNVFCQQLFKHKIGRWFEPHRIFKYDFWYGFEEVIKIISNIDSNRV